MVHFPLYFVLLLVTHFALLICILCRSPASCSSSCFVQFVLISWVHLALYSLCRSPGCISSCIVQISCIVLCRSLACGSSCIALCAVGSDSSCIANVYFVQIQCQWFILHCIALFKSLAAVHLASYCVQISCLRLIFQVNQISLAAVHLASYCVQISCLRLIMIFQVNQISCCSSFCIVLCADLLLEVHLPDQPGSHQHSA